MKKTDIFYVNLFNSGYTLINAEELSNDLNLALLNYDYPVIKSSDSVSISYTLSYISLDDVLVSVTSWWPNLQDEHGRKGLLFVHHLHCLLESDDTLPEIAMAAISLVDCYIDLENDISTNIKNLAVSDFSNSLLEDFKQFSNGKYSKVQIASLIDAFLKWRRKPVSEKVNIYCDFPYRSTSSIPCLISFLLTGDSGRSAAGGEIDIRDVVKYDMISIMIGTSSHTTTINLSDIVDVKNAYDQSRKRNTNSNDNFTSNKEDNKFFYSFFSRRKKRRSALELKISNFMSFKLIERQLEMTKRKVQQMEAEHIKQKKQVQSIISRHKILIDDLQQILHMDNEVE